jgi:hypothetical protein
VQGEAALALCREKEVDFAASDGDCTRADVSPSNETDIPRRNGRCRRSCRTSPSIVFRCIRSVVPSFRTYPIISAIERPWNADRIRPEYANGLVAVFTASAKRRVMAPPALMFGFGLRTPAPIECNLLTSRSRPIHDSAFTGIREGIMKGIP